MGLNTPYGARCFLTRSSWGSNENISRVLMRLMVLGACSRPATWSVSTGTTTGLNSPYGAQCLLTRFGPD